MRKKCFAILTVLALAATGLRAETVTVAALGDSLTQGYGLEEENGLVPQLQRWLDAKGADAVLINAGVSGDTTAGGVSRVGWTLTPDVDAMILELGANDMLRGIDPGVTRANLEKILQVADQAGVPVLLVGVQATGNMGPEFKAEFDAIYPELAEAYGASLVPDFFNGIASIAEDRTEARPYFQPDGMHPSAEGVVVIVADIGPAVLDFVESVRAEAK